MRVLITDLLHASFAEERRVLEPLGVEIDTTFCASEEDLIRSGRDAVGFLVTYAPVTRRVLEALPSLKIVVKYGVGVDNIDVAAARSLGVVVANVPDYCVQEVASQALALGMAGLRRLPRFADRVKTGRWTDNPLKEGMQRPSSVCLGLLGFGNIARQLAAYAAPLFGRTVFYDPFLRLPLPAGVSPAEGVEDLAKLFEMSQMVSIHAPLTPQTRGIVRADVLRRGRGVVLVNTSRGGLVDRPSIEAALNSGAVSFFGSDTFWEEPPDLSASWTASFLARDDVLITPHVGWCSTESETELRRKAAEEVARVIRGEAPLHPL